MAAANEWGGSPFHVDGWGTEEGLPQNSVIALAQGRDGYLWLGTLNGLVRFDGARFTVFDENNTPDLSSGRVVFLFEDSQRNLWVGTESAGVVLIQNGRVKSLDIGRGQREGRLLAACEDARGAVWLYTADGQLCRHHQGRVDVWRFGADFPSACRALAFEPPGTVWVGVDWGLYGLNVLTNTDPRDLPLQQVVPLRRLDAVVARRQGGLWRLAEGRVQVWRDGRVERDLGAYPWEGAPVSVAVEDTAGNLIVGTLGRGVYWFDAEGRATRLSTAEGLSNDVILSLWVEPEGTLWVGTDGGGLNHVRRKVFRRLAAAGEGVVQSVCSEAAGALWIGFNASGAVRWQPERTERFGPEQGLLSPNVWAVLVDQSQQVWAGTRGAGLFQLQGERFRPSPDAAMLAREIFALHQDRQGALWVGTQNGLARWDKGRWRLFTTVSGEGLSANLVRALAEDAEGNLWVGTERGGLNVLRQGRFTTFRKSADGLPSDDISALLVDPDGAVWVGTFGAGLARWERGQWTRFSTRDGLVGNSIGYLLLDDADHLWIGSTAGLMRVARAALNDYARGVMDFLPVRGYGRSDGLPTRECTQGSQPMAHRDGRGRLWFPTIKGLVSVTPEQLRRNTNPPPVIIESVLVEGREQITNALQPGTLTRVTIPARRERLEIHYTALNLAAPERVRFRYRLEGSERAWTDAGTSRVARPGKLPPGQYTFRVTACNEDGVWNEHGATLAVVVLPPFWRTWWFLGGSALALLALVASAVHYFSTQRLQRQLERMRQQEALERERARIARDLHDQLGANLTQVALLGELVEADKEQPAEVEAHAQQISQTARETTRALDEIVWAANPANDTLEGLVNYACKYAQEYLALAGVRHRWEAPAQLPARALAPEVRHNVFLAFKEAINNVVKHARATEVHVRVRIASDRFTLEVEDNGCGLPPTAVESSGTRNGLRNMRKRMEDVGGEFRLESVPTGGTRVGLTAPLRPE